MDDRERQRDAENDEREVRDSSGTFGGQDVGEELADIGEDRAAFLDRGDDAREVVVEQHHVGSLARDVRAAAPIAMPMSARFRKAGASLTPSPVTATIARFFFSALTMRIFCSARTRANTISGASSASWSWMSERCPSCSPVITTGVAERTSPISRAIAVAVSPLWHIRHNDADGENEILPKRQPDRATDEDEDHPERERESGHNAADADDLDLQRGNRVGGRLGELRDLPERGMRAGREDERLRFAGDERSAGEERVAAVHRLGLVAWLGVARCRQRLAGDGRVVHSHAERLHEAAVRGEDVTGFEQDHVARHELGRGHLPYGARAHDLRRIWEQFLERRQCLLGAIRLPEREHAVDQDYAKGVTTTRSSFEPVEKPPLNMADGQQHAIEILLAGVFELFMQVWFLELRAALCRARLPRHRRKRRGKLPNGVLTLPARWISLSIALSPSVFLLAQVITSRPGRNDPRVPSTKL